MTQKFTTTVATPAEHREAVKAADVLGFSLDSVEARGAWLADDGSKWGFEPAFIAGTTVDVENVGRKFWHLHIDGQVMPSKPDPDSPTKDAGTLRLTFTDSGAN